MLKHYLSKTIYSINQIYFCVYRLKNIIKYTIILRAVIFGKDNISYSIRFTEVTLFIQHDIEKYFKL